MTRYVLTRLATLLVTLVLLSLGVFLLMHSIPGGPFGKEWNNAEFNKLTNEAAGYPDFDKRIQMYTDANRILSEDVGGAFLYHWGHAQMWKPYVQGIPTDAQGNTRVPYYNLGMNDIYVAPH